MKALIVPVEAKVCWPLFVQAEDAIRFSAAVAKLIPQSKPLPPIVTEADLYSAKEFRARISVGGVVAEPVVDITGPVVGYSYFDELQHYVFDLNGQLVGQVCRFVECASVEI